MKLITTLIIAISILINPVQDNEISYMIHEVLPHVDLYEYGYNYHIKPIAYHHMSNDINYYQLFALYKEGVLEGFIFKHNNTYSVGEYFATAISKHVDVSDEFEIWFYQDKIMMKLKNKTILVDNFQKTESHDNFIRRDYGSEVANLPQRGMNTSQDCWAASMAAVISFKGNNTSTASVVATTNNSGLASLNSVSNYLSNIYGISNQLYQYQLGFNQALTHIGNNRPIIAQCNRANGASHMVVIKGVYYLTSGNNNAMYKLMDPYSSSSVNVITTTSAVLSFVSYGGYTYQWGSSIVIN